MGSLFYSSIAALANEKHIIRCEEKWPQETALTCKTLCGIHFGNSDLMRKYCPAGTVWKWFVCKWYYVACWSKSGLWDIFPGLDFGTIAGMVVVVESRSMKEIWNDFFIYQNSFEESLSLSSQCNCVSEKMLLLNTKYVFSNVKYLDIDELATLFKAVTAWLEWSKIHLIAPSDQVHINQMPDWLISALSTLRVSHLMVINCVASNRPIRKPSRLRTVINSTMILARIPWEESKKSFINSEGITFPNDASPPLSPPTLTTLFDAAAADWCYYRAL